MLPDPVDLLTSEQDRQYRSWLEDIKDGICPRCGADLIELDKYIRCVRPECGFAEYNSTGVRPEIEINVELEDIGF